MCTDMLKNGVYVRPTQESVDIQFAKAARYTHFFATVD